MTSAETAPRTYGSWRRARGFGVGQLGPGQTVTLFVAMLVPVLIAYLSARLALITGLAAALVVATVVVRVGGQDRKSVV